MKILFYRYGSICEPFLLSAFQEAGIQVTEINNEIMNKAFSPAECAKIVSRTLMDDDYSFIFTINFFPTISDVCSILKLKYIGWIVDSPVMELYSTSIQNGCNYIFIFDRCLFQEIEPLNPGHVFHMPLATDVAHMDRTIQAAAPALHQQFTSSISFVGSLYTEKCPYDQLKPTHYLNGFLNGIMEAQLNVYGYYFIEELLTESMIQEFKACLPHLYSTADCKFLTDAAVIAQLYIGGKISATERIRAMKMLAAHFDVDIYTASDTNQIPRLKNCGLANTMTEMPLIFHNSFINLNITAKSIRSGLSLRIWDILGCQGFLITNYQSELTDFLTIGEELETYSSMAELYDKCQYYLEHPAKAKEIAHNAYNVIRNKHTYLHRLEQIFELITLASEKRK